MLITQLGGPYTGFGRVRRVPQSVASRSQALFVAPYALTLKELWLGFDEDIEITDDEAEPRLKITVDNSDHTATLSGVYGHMIHWELPEPILLWAGDRIILTKMGSGWVLPDGVVTVVYHM